MSPLLYIMPDIPICFIHSLPIETTCFFHSFPTHFFSELVIFSSNPDSRILSMETVELKVEMVGIHEKRLRKSLSKLKGIEKVEVDAYSQKVVVTGYAHKNRMLKAIRRGGLKADFWSPQNELLTVYASATTLRFNNLNFF